MSAKTRYIERNYKEVKIKKTFWAELKKLADEMNMSVPEIIQELYQHYVTCNCRPQLQNQLQNNTDTSSVPPQNCGGGVSG